MLQARLGGGHEFAAKGLEHGKLLVRVDADGAGLLAHQVAQHALQQAQVLVQQRGRRQFQRSLFGARPGFAQIGNVLGQLSIGRFFAVGAQNKTAAAQSTARVFGAHQRLQARAQGVALGGRNFLRDANVVVLRQKHQQPPGNADLR